MDAKDKGSLQKAKNYAFLLLKFRLRSEKELYQRLKKKKFEQSVISQTLCFLKEKGFIDDNIFAKTWIESRLKKPLGLRRLVQELRFKGISKDIIDNQISRIKSAYQEEDIVLDLAKRRLNKLKGLEPDKAKRRIYSYLALRGFSPEVIIDVVRQL